MTEGKQKQDKKGIALLIVIGTVFMAIFLANVVLSIITSHSRLTHHQVSRIRAYYAAQAAMNLAFERLRTETWTTGSYSLCSSGCTVNDADIPYRVDINIFAPDTTTGIRTITLTTNYTYTP